MITIEKLNIYRKYAGLYDGLERVGTDLQKQLFDEGDWVMISDCEHDIELIKTRLASVEYQNKLVHKLRTNFDKQAFVEITKSIAEIIS